MPALHAAEARAKKIDSWNFSIYAGARLKKQLQHEILRAWQH